MLYVELFIGFGESKIKFSIYVQMISTGPTTHVLIGLTGIENCGICFQSVRVFLREPFWS